jgi:hypothetical protein
MSLANYKTRCIEKYKNANPDKDIPANMGSKWTDTEEQALLKNIKDDLGIEEIAKKHGRTSGAINVRLEVIAIRMCEENRYDIEYIEELTKLNERDIRNAIERKQNYKTQYGANAAAPIYNDSEVLVSGLRKELSRCFEEIKGLKETVRTLMERESRNDIEELKKQIQSMLDINTIKNDIIELKNAIGT